ncbi:MAG TPA: hypothetical protein VJY35_15375, partial [Candidatus Eisenbacteria bacterium]|nr:hypothetical protein [Candidatus Eisenbacteria bacterium]
GAFMRLFMRDPVERGAFRLASAYLARDRDMRMRIYPSLAMVVVFPLLAIVDPGRTARYASLITVFIVGTLPATTMMTFKMSPHYLAAELFRYAPMHGTASLFHGVRKAMLLFLVTPALVLAGTLLWLGTADPHTLRIAIPALLSIPTLSLLDGLTGDYLPLSIAPTSGRQGAIGVGIMIVGFMLLAAFGGIAAVADAQGWFWQLVAAEVVLLSIAHPLLLRVIRARALARGGE